MDSHVPPDPDWQARNRWSRTYDPSGARRPGFTPRGPRLLSTALVFLVAVLALTRCT